MATNAPASLPVPAGAVAGAAQGANQAPYQFENADSDTIVRVIGFAYDLALTAISFAPAEHDRARESVTKPCRPHWNHVGGFGRFSTLPVELMVYILLMLDIRSLFGFRQVSSAARDMVHSLHEYRNISAHGMNFLCTMLRLQQRNGLNGLTHTITDLHNLLITKTCALCGEFGGYIAILTMQRCCKRCLENARQLKVRSIGTCERELGICLTSRRWQMLRTLKSFPGVYTPNFTGRQAPFHIVSVPQVEQLTGRPLNTNFTRGETQLAYMSSCALPYYDQQKKTAHRGLACVGCQCTTTEGPINTRGLRSKCETLYTRDDLLEHFRHCRRAQRLWESTDKGTRQAVMLDTLRNFHDMQIFREDRARVSSATLVARTRARQQPARQPPAHQP